MVRPMYSYTATHRIPDSGPAAYQRGDDVTADAVERWGLVIGEDVIAARADVVPRPAVNAGRADWETYAKARGLTDLDDLTVADIRAKFPEGDEPESFVRLDDVPDRLHPVDPAVVTEQGRRLPPELARTDRTPDEAVATGVDAVNVPAGEVASGEQSARPPVSASKAEWVEYAIGQGLTEDEANEFTKADLVKRYGE